jgi:hypothetical protein
MVSLLVSITLKPLPCMGFLLVILVVKFFVIYNFVDIQGKGFKVMLTSRLTIC